MFAAAPLRAEIRDRRCPLLRRGESTKVARRARTFWCDVGPSNWIPVQCHRGIQPPDAGFGAREGSLDPGISYPLFHAAQPRWLPVQGHRGGQRLRRTVLDPGRLP